jgi:hypothetical protein
MADLGYDMFIINIDDGTGTGRLKPPIRVLPHINITLEGGHHINVMFSTEEKVRKRWTT